MFKVVSITINPRSKCVLLLVSRQSGVDNQFTHLVLYLISCRTLPARNLETVVHISHRLNSSLFLQTERPQKLSRKHFMQLGFQSCLYPFYCCHCMQKCVPYLALFWEYFVISSRQTMHIDRTITRLSESIHASQREWWRNETISSSRQANRAANITQAFRTVVVKQEDRTSLSTYNKGSAY